MMLCSAQMMPQSMAYGGGPSKRHQPRKMLATKAMRHSAPATGGVSKKKRKAKKLTMRKTTGGRAPPKNPKICNADSVAEADANSVAKADAEAMEVQSPDDHFETVTGGGSSVEGKPGKMQYIFFNF